MAQLKKIPLWTKREKRFEEKYMRFTRERNTLHLYLKLRTKFPFLSQTRSIGPEDLNCFVVSSCLQKEKDVIGDLWQSEGQPPLLNLELLMLLPVIDAKAADIFFV